MKKKEAVAAARKETPELSLATLSVAYEVIRQVPASNAQQAVRVANALVELEAYIAQVYPQAVQPQQQVAVEKPKDAGDA